MDVVPNNFIIDYEETLSVIEYCQTFRSKYELCWLYGDKHMEDLNNVSISVLYVELSSQ